MAATITNFIDRIQLGNDEAHQVAIGSSAYGICTTAANEAAKVAIIQGFTLNNGATIHIKFIDGNTAANPTLSIQYSNISTDKTEAKAIYEYDGTPVRTSGNYLGWQEGAILTLTYDGTNWIINNGYNIIVDRVKHNAKTDNVNYKILLSAGGATLTDGNSYEAAYNTGLTFNPNTHTLTIYDGTNIGTLTPTQYNGTAASASSVEWTNIQNKPNLVNSLDGQTGDIELLNLIGANDCAIVTDTIDNIQKLVSRALKITEDDSTHEITLTNNVNNAHINIEASGTGNIEISSAYGSLALKGGNANSNTQSILTLGNSSSTDNSSKGKIILYSSLANLHTIVGKEQENSVIEYTHTLPNDTGWLASGAAGGVANNVTLMYLASTGVLTASSQTVGSGTQPVYLNSGSITELTFTANRLYYSAATNSFEATGHYASSTQIGINITSWPQDNNTDIPEVLYVNGDSIFSGIVRITDTTDIVANTSNGALIVSGGATIAQKVSIGGNTSIGGTLNVTGATTLNNTLSVNDTSTLTGRVGIGGAPDSATTGDQHILTIYGSTLFTDNTKSAHLDIVTNTVDNTITHDIKFYPDSDKDGYIGLSDHRWHSGYFSNLLEVDNDTGIISIDSTGFISITDGNSNIELDTRQNSNVNESKITVMAGNTISNGSIVLYTKNTLNAPESQITLTGLDPTILLETTNSSASSWIIHNNNGTFSLNNQAVFPIELQGTDDGFKLTNRLYINEELANQNDYILYIGDGDTFSEGNIIPSVGNNSTAINTLGSTSNRWAAVYIGDRDTHGDEYTPIYWNNGVPTQVPVVQKYDFTIVNNTSSISILLSNTYRDFAIVTSIVVTSGISYLNAPLTWSINTTNHTIDIISMYPGANAGTNVSNDVSGYILVSSGIDIDASPTVTFEVNSNT